MGKHKKENCSERSEGHLQHSVLGQVYKKQKAFSGNLTYWQTNQFLVSSQNSVGSVGKDFS